MGKKKFIDKKNAVTFRLVNRSQQDPLYVDERAPQNVLLPLRIPEKYSKLAGGQSRQEPSGSKIDPAKRKTEQAKYGVFFDDDYDYLQHLREPGRNEVFWEPIDSKTTKEQPGAQKVSIKLPSSVFASQFEEKEGIMKKAANARPGPRPDWDPDVVAALDEDFDFENPENELEDNFMELAMQEGGGGGDEFLDEDDEQDIDSDGMDDDYLDEERDGLGPLGDEYGREETKSRFTEYSMSSSVIRRNEQLTLLDDRFEKFYEQYDDPEVGALDCEEIEGHVEVNDDVLLRCAEEFKRENEENFEVEFEKRWVRERLLELQEESSGDEQLVEMEVENSEQKKWDCESILSTYSNIYNHPKLIEEPKRNRKIKINSKTGLPENVLGSEGGKLTMKSLAKLEQGESAKASGPKSLCDGSVISTLSVLSLRPKDETLEEKRERKKLLKEYRAERRIERKANTQAFKEEKKMQEKSKINAHMNSGKTIV
ncbi:protein LTV1 homolog [Anopheles ziemanni]|uniref:protein LTV1 homolog n=1 Tax=Anopheles coustani TaxID=139045 RepID=UPI00265877DF|nr:protein LTV1 homolog [Anopheles coustani]XP_058171447.1 protein LTV1 homolog [Anopheles ziemanni]